MRREADGKVTLWDLVSNKALRVNAPTARENLKNNSARYVTKEEFDASVNQRRIDEAVEKQVAEAMAEKQTVVKPSNDDVEKDLIDAHNKVLEEAGDEDDRLTPTRLVKKKVLAGLVDREIDGTEYAKYSKFVQTARAAQAE